MRWSQCATIDNGRVTYPQDRLYEGPRIYRKILEKILQRGGGSIGGRSSEGSGGERLYDNVESAAASRK